MIAPVASAAICIAGLLAGGVVATGLAGCARKPRLPEVAGPESAREAGRLAMEARAALDKGELEKAIELSRRSIAVNDRIYGTWNNLGVALMRQGDGMAAADAFRRAADLAPTDPRPMENLGNVYAEAGFDAEAIEQYAAALERDPNWLPALRHGVRSAKSIRRSDERTLEWTRRGLLMEKDKAWRDVFAVERMRVERDLAEQQEAAKNARQ